MGSIIWSYGILPSLLCYLILNLRDPILCAWECWYHHHVIYAFWNCAVTSEEVFDFYRKKRSALRHSTYILWLFLYHFLASGMVCADSVF